MISSAADSFGRDEPALCFGSLDDESPLHMGRRCDDQASGRTQLARIFPEPAGSREAGHETQIRNRGVLSPKLHSKELHDVVTILSQKSRSVIVEQHKVAGSIRKLRDFDQGVVRE